VLACSEKPSKKAQRRSGASGVRASAVLGVMGVKKMIFNAIVLFSRRQMNLFDSIDSARQWLAQH